MADKIVTSRVFNVEAEFADGDTRTIAIKNYRADITEAEVRAGETLTARVLIGDRNGAKFKTFKGAKFRDTDSIHYDLNG